jgi:hypothetical protein
LPFGSSTDPKNSKRATQRERRAHQTATTTKTLLIFKNSAASKKLSASIVSIPGELTLVQGKADVPLAPGKFWKKCLGCLLERLDALVVVRRSGREQFEMRRAFWHN